jgi:hypothetical protein
MIILIVFYKGVGDIMMHPSWRLMSAEDCGYSNQGRIIGGHEPDLGTFPWIARLGYISEFLI